MLYLIITTVLLLSHVDSLPLENPTEAEEQLANEDEEMIVAQVDRDIKDLQGLNLKIRGLRCRNKNGN